MTFNYRSSSDLFTKALKEYTEEKLSRPVERHQIEDDSIRFDCEAAKHRERVGLRVLMSYPGVKITISTLHEDAYAAVDLAVDKLERKLRETEDRRRTMKRRKSRLIPEDEVDVLMTQDEEEVLREMGALEDVLEASLG
ncbi:MAG TPA: ribosome-associated translation inhibitor RaiA [Myxococcota bacterium]|nr:ribosome-associated translation inhibitor RaiA [Myxococcota bacterium]